MQILLIDNTIDRDSWGSSELVACLSNHPGVTVHVRRAPAEDIPPLGALTQFDRIVLSGSRTPAMDVFPWTTKLARLIAESLERSIPLLGVCYGHQALARVLGARCHRAARPEIGWTRIRQTKNPAPSKLFSGLPAEFHSFSLHFDEVVDLPARTLRLASSDACGIQAFAHQEKPAFGIQFHPERGIEAGERTLAARRRSHPSLELLGRGEGKNLHSAEVARIIFGNFISGQW